jgi:hypothetical protein
VYLRLGMSTIFEGGKPVNETGIAKILQLYRQGLTSSDIARKTGVPTWAVELILKLELA